MSKTIEELIYEKEQDQERKRLEEEQKRLAEEQKQVEMILSASYKEYNLKGFLDTIRSQIISETELVEDFYYAFKVKNKLAANAIEEMFEDYKDQVEDKVYENNSILHRVVFKTPSAMCYIARPDVNFEEKIKDYESSQKYDNNSLNAYLELLNPDVNDYKNKFKDIMCHFYHINEEQATKFIDSCFQTTDEKFKKYPYAGSSEVYSFQILNYTFGDKEKKIYKHNIDTMCDVLSKNKILNYRKISDGFISNMYHSALNASGLSELKFKLFDFEKINYEDYEDIAKQLKEKIDQHTFPKTESFSGRNPFAFFHICNMKERDYNQHTSIVMELFNIANAINVVNYLSKVIDFAEKIKDSDKKYTKEEIQEILTNFAHETKVVQRKKPKI